MHKCRNCKKEIDANATRCPYCLTHMPASSFLGNLKNTFIGIAVLGFFIFVMIYSFVIMVKNFDFSTFTFFPAAILAVIGIILGGAAVGCFSNSKKWGNKSDSPCSVKDYIIAGIVCTVIAILLFSFSTLIIISLI